MEMKNKNIYYVYGLLNPLDDQIFYIGKGVNNRAYTHLKPSGYGNNPHKSYKIKKIRENGSEPVVIFLHQNLDEKTAFYMETVEIKKLKENGIKLTNMTNGGEGGPIRYGRRCDAERKIIAEKTKKAMWKPEIRERHLASIRNDANRKKLSENQILKLKSNTEWYEKFTKSNYKEKYRNLKVIRDDGKIFNSVDEVAKFYGTRLNVITRHLDGKRKTYKKHKFKYLDTI